MNLEQQMQALIDNAPQDGQTPMIMEAIAPVLKHFADRLQHSQYYILQSPHQSWLVTTLSNRNQPELEKNVIYAFTTPQDSLSFQPHSQSPSQPRTQPQNPALAIPVLQILFQMFALTMVDSVIFFEVPGNMVNGTEVRRQDLATAIQDQLRQIRTIHKKNPPPNPPKNPNNPPSNIA